MSFIIIISKMDSHSLPKKKTENSNLKKAASTQNLHKQQKKSNLKQTVSAASLLKNTLQASTFHTFTSKALPKKGTKKKFGKAKKSTKNKQNGNPKSKTKIKLNHGSGKSRKQKIVELTDRKKIHLEFFMYKDVYVPIENTEQRKLVYKINLIDERITTLVTENKTQKSVREKSTATECAQSISTATDPISPPFTTSNESQTEQEHRQSGASSNLSSSQPQKCFLSTLAELEFLYLPDEKNFDGFSQSQKIHYKDLFLYLAKKFDQEKKPFDDSAIQAMISERECMQRGLIQAHLKKGIPTHMPSVLSYLANLFCYLDIHDKKYLVERINCNYGYELNEKLARIRHGLPTRRPSKLISENLFWQFQEQLHAQMNFDSPEVQQLLHYHNKAIFDCVNEYLEYFQPYFSCSGEPFPWNYGFETTFYCITPETFNALHCQIKQKVWEASITLAGIIIDTQEQEKSKFHIHKIIENEKSMLFKQIRKIDDKIEVDETCTKLLLSISDMIEAELMMELSWLRRADE